MKGDRPIKKKKQWGGGVIGEWRIDQLRTTMIFSLQ